MKTFENILLIGPITEQLTSTAIRLLRTSQSRLTLLSVAPPLENPEIRTEADEVIRIQELLEGDLKSQLESIANRLKLKTEVEIQTRVVSGQPFLETTRQVIANQHDLVVMLADAPETLRQRMFGTQSMHLMRKCPCPIWVLKPGKRRRLRNVFAAVDPSSDPKRDQLNMDILSLAQSIANLDGVRLHVIHAWDGLGVDSKRSHRWVSRADIQLYREKILTEHRRNLKTLIERAELSRYHVHLVRGKPDESIVDITTREAADLLVMGTVCRTGIPGFFIGNTAENVLNHVNCSVLTLKPNDFQTPITPA